MKRQVLAPKNSVFFFTALLFIYIIHGVAYAEDLKFIEGETTTREIAKNAAIGTNVGDPLRFAFGNCRRFRLSGPDARLFSLVRVNRGVQLKTKSTFDYETQNSYEVQVIATSAWNSDTITVTINVTNVNEAPMFLQANGASGANRIHRSVLENTATGTNIGDPVSAADPDGSEVPLSYSLSGPNANMFAIDSDIGQLKTQVLLDYEAFDSEPRAYSIDVRVSDGEMSDEIQIWIDVEPVNEFTPAFTEGDTTTREIHEKEAVGSNVGEPVSAIDMDMGETLAYSIDGAGSETFNIDSGTGQLRIKTALDYLTKPSYTLKVLASDGSRVGSIIITVRVLADFVDIPDPNLARVIRRKLGLDRHANITQKSMSALTVLNYNRRKPEIRDITGLEHAINLTTLLLDYN